MGIADVFCLETPVMRAPVVSDALADCVGLGISVVLGLSLPGQSRDNLYALFMPTQ